MPSDEANLPDRMDALAKTHPQADELQAKAAALRDAISGFYSTPQQVDVRRFMGCWARARRLWCECTGEPLI
jgi:hypothetical protein